MAKKIHVVKVGSVCLGRHTYVESVHSSKKLAETWLRENGYKYDKIETVFLDGDRSKFAFINAYDLDPKVKTD